MKGFLTCALCFVSLPVCAVPLYYNKNGTCNGLYATQSCSATPVTHLNVTPVSDSEFNGFFINNQQVVDANGNVVSDAGSILRTANAGGKILQNYTCKGNLSKNKYGLCVDTSGNTSYIDFVNGDEEDGYEVHYNEIGEGGGDRSECKYYSKFKVRIHWCPPKYGAYTSNTWTGLAAGLSGWNPPSVPRGFGYPEFWPEDCENGDITEDLYYEWHDRKDATPGHENATYRTGSYNGDIKRKLNIPTGKFNGWTLRGFYLRRDDLSQAGYYNSSGQWVDCPSGTNVPYDYYCYNYWGQRNYFAKRRIVSQTNTEGTARLGLPTTVDPTYPGDIQLNDGQLYNWGNTRWAVWSCEPISEEDTLHLFAGWAKDCIAPEDGTCNIVVKRTGLYQNNDKGDVFYHATCNSGFLPTGSNTYAPECPEQPKTIELIYKYQDTNGVTRHCTGGPANGSCSTSSNFTLANSTGISCDGTNLLFARWRTPDGVLREANSTAACSSSVLGVGTSASITGVLCNCNLTYHSSGAPIDAICADLCTPVGTPLNLGVGFTVNENVEAGDN